MGQKLTIKEMAAIAGVSVATVSRAMNPETRGMVSTSTLAKIDELVAQYRYTPNQAAKNLRQVKTKNIGVVFPYLPGIFYSPYYLHILNAVADTLAETEYQLKVVLLKQDRVSWDNYNFQIAEQVDALVMTHWFMFFQSKESFNEVELPCVVLNDYEEGVDAFHTYVDQYDGGCQVAAHLWQNGHRRCGVFQGPFWSKDSQQRVKGFCDTMVKHGVSIDDKAIVAADFTEEIAYQKAADYFQANPDLTAVFCCNDLMARGVLRYCQEKNISCPGKMALVGFDDDPFCEQLTPSLTSVASPIYKMTHDSTISLLKVLRSEQDLESFSGSKKYPVSLIERDSSVS